MDKNTSILLFSRQQPLLSRHCAYNNPAQALSQALQEFNWNEHTSQQETSTLRHLYKK
jgi:hypothetical protein